MNRRHHADVKRFDQWAPHYDCAPGQLFFRLIDRPVLRALAEEPRPRVVVDVGCGTGRLLESLLPLLPETQLVGVDPSEGMIAVARRRFQDHPRVRLDVAGADHLPLGDASADVVMTTISFHHWERQGPSLEEVARVLEPGGRLLIADILGIGLVGRLMQTFAGRHGSGYRAGTDLVSMLREAGFRSWRFRRPYGPLVPIFLVEARRARAG